MEINPLKTACGCPSGGVIKYAILSPNDKMHLLIKNWIWVIFLKTGQNCDIEGKNSKCEFFLMLLFGNESLTSLVYINIK